MYVHGEIRKYFPYLELCLAPNSAMVPLSKLNKRTLHVNRIPMLIKILTHEKRDLRGICEHKIRGQRMS